MTRYLHILTAGLSRRPLHGAVLLLLLLGNIVRPVRAQKGAGDYYRESMEAYREGDTEAFYRAAGRADSLRPWHPVLSYNLAAALALRGEHGRALEKLAARSRLYADTAFAKDPDFVGLRDLADYRNLLAAVRARNRTLQSSRPYATLEEKDFHAEALAWSPLDGAFLAGDIRRGRVVAFDSLGRTLREVVRLEEHGFWSAFALEIDPRDATRLWVATSAVPEFAGWSDSLEGRAALLEVNLRKGEVAAAHELPGRHHFGDLEIGGDGTVFLSDGLQPVIWRLSPGGAALDTLVRHEGFGNLQGLALDRQTGTLYAADYPTGIYSMRTAEGSVAEPLFPGDHYLLKGTDGLAWHEGRLYTIQNGTLPMRLSEVDPGAGTAAEGIRVLDRALQSYGEPTTGIVLQKSVYYIVNSPWGYYGDDRRPRATGWPPALIHRYDIR